jgi:hypothetical protein
MGAACALLAGACTHRPRPPGPPRTTVPSTAATTTTTAPPATTTTTTGHGHGHEEPGGDDKGWSLLGNGHQHPHTEEPLDAATQTELDRQLAITRQLLTKFPTVGTAVAAGYRRAGAFSPGLGAHYMEPFGSGFPGSSPSPNGAMTDEQLLHPMLIFNGTTPEAPLIGFMYYAMGTSGVPEGFAGPNDVWHYHTNVCISVGAEGIDAPLGADRDVTAEQCAAVGGRLLPVTGYMAHLWSVPGWENPDGLFSELNPKITCKDGTYWTVPFDQIGTNSTMCRDEAVVG